MRARWAIGGGLLAGALLLSGCGGAPSATPTLPAPAVATVPPTPLAAPTPPPAPTALVAVRDGGTLRLIEPATGRERWRGGAPDAILSVAAGSAALFLGITTPDGARTDILAVSLADFTTERIGSVAANLSVETIAADGTALYLLAYAPDKGDFVPDGVRTVPIPQYWWGAARGLPYAVSGALVAPDGRAWYRLEGTTLVLTQEQANGGRDETRLDLGVPPDPSTESLLISPDGRTLYVVDYRDGERVIAVDVMRRAVVRSTEIRPGESAKQPACAAALAPRGDRLYIAARNGSDTQGSGIDVIETATMQRIATLLPERQFYCLAAAPDGSRIYAAGGSPYFAAQPVPTVTTIAVPSGVAEVTVRIPLDTTPFLALAVVMDESGGTGPRG